MLMQWGKKMTSCPPVKKASQADACLLNGQAGEQRIARLKPQSRAACGINVASLRQYPALAPRTRDRGQGLKADRPDRLA
jgi:hypothetical protein